MYITIDGEKLEVSKVYHTGYLPMLETDGGEFYIAESSEEAGAAAREYWKDLAENDPEEFACIVGSETLIAWGLGRSDGPGAIGVRSLDEWLNLWLDTPAEQWASYDGQEIEDVRGPSYALLEELEWDYEPGGEWVMYRVS